MTTDTPSRRSSDQPIKFRWYGFPSADLGSDLDVATNAFLAAFDKPGRLWNPYNRSMLRAEFRNRIKLGSAGQLEPVNQVKSIDQKNPLPMYEIRWQGITVTSRVDQDKQRFDTVLARMYHSEPASAPDYFVGHHIHEKLIEGDETNALQTAEISIAKRFYTIGESTMWGIDVLSAPTDPI